MTTITTRPTTSHAAVAPIGVAAGLVAVTGTAIGAHDWAELLVVGAVIVAATALIFGLVVPRALRKESAGGTALGLAIPALLLLLPAFWSGLPFVLGVAAVVVGNAGRRAPTGAGKCIAALVMGGLAAVGYVAIYVSDTISTGGGFLFGG